MCLLALGVQPDAEVVLVPGGDFLVAGPVVPGGPVPDHGGQPVLPSGFVGYRPWWPLPVGEHGEPVAVGRCEGACRGVVRRFYSQDASVRSATSSAAREGYLPVSWTMATSSRIRAIP